jgi:thiosulfate/3-mercaptopyruvate sulfurtransferase
VPVLVYPYHPPAPRWQQLVTPDWLDELTAGRSKAPAADWQLFEVGNDAVQAYSSGHIAAAAYLDTNCFEHAPFWNKVADTELLQYLLAKGIAHDSCIILYGRNNLAAARVAHLLLYAGVQDVRLLDGGLAAWNAAGWFCRVN